MTFKNNNNNNNESKLVLKQQQQQDTNKQNNQEKNLKLDHEPIARFNPSPFIRLIMSPHGNFVYSCN